MSKTVAEPERPQTIRRMRITCWISKATKAQKHVRARAPTPTHRPICNNYCFSTATIVSWTRLKVTLYVHCLSCSNLTDNAQNKLGRLVAWSVILLHCSVKSSVQSGISGSQKPCLSAKVHQTDKHEMTTSTRCDWMQGIALIHSRPPPLVCSILEWID
jgi:hypothetical protein